MTFIEKSTPTTGSKDQAIAQTVRDSLSTMPGSKITELKVEVSGGIVTLSGKSVDNSMAERVLSMVKAIPGVKSVANKIVFGSVGKSSEGISPLKTPAAPEHATPIATINKPFHEASRPEKPADEMSRPQAPKKEAGPDEKRHGEPNATPEKKAI